MKLYDVKMFTCHASSKLCQLSHTQAESDWDWVTDTLRKQLTCTPCSELGQLEVTSQTCIFQIVEILSDRCCKD